MLPIAYYFLQVILCTALMVGYYWLVLRNKRFHQYNRFYLLAITALSWIVPLIKIQWGRVPEDYPLQFLSVVADSNSEIEASLTRKGFQWNWDAFAGVVYFAVAGILLIGMIRAMIKIYQLLKTHSCKSVGEVYLILTQAQGTPFSFFRYIFWNEGIDLRSDAGKQILQHELTHVQQKHSFDKLFMQIVLIAGWFNPFFWLIRKELDLIHEFIADRKAVNNGDTASLAQMLLTAAYPQQQFLLTNPFFFSPIKRRLQMLTNNTNPRFSYIRRLVVLPLMGVVVILFAFRNKEEKTITISVAAAVEKAVEKGRQLITVEDIPLYPAAKKDTVILEANTVYIEGKDKHDVIKIVPVSPKQALPGNPLYIIDGQKADSTAFKKVDVNQIHSVDVLKDATAIALYGDEARNGVVIIKTNAYVQSTEDAGRLAVEVANKANNWIRPQKQNMVSGFQPTYKSQSDIRKDIWGDKKPLMIVDGEKVDYRLLDTLSPSSIDRVEVLKNESAKALYGDEGKDGVVMITTKQNASRMRVANATEAKLGYPIVTNVQTQIQKPGDPIITNVRTETQKPGDPNVTNVQTQIQMSPKFPGGDEAWKKYLQRNLNLDLPVEKGAPPGKYTVVVSFIVDKEGNLSDIHALTDPGYGTKDEAIRMIAKGPKWVPAEVDGKKVIYKHEQKITWMISGDEMITRTDGDRPKTFLKTDAKGNVTWKPETKTEKEIEFDKKLEQAKANNNKTFFYIDGMSCVVTAAGSRAEIPGLVDIVIVNGKRMTPDELNKKFSRKDFILAAANDTEDIIIKYGKGILLVSSTKLTLQEINAKMDPEKYRSEPK